MTIGTVFEEFRFVVLLLTAQIMLLIPLTKRDRAFWIKATLGFAACLALSLLFFPLRIWFWSFPTQTIVSVFHVSWYFILALITGIYTKFVFKINWTETFWLLILVYAMYGIQYFLITEMVFMGFARPLRQNYWWAYALISIALFALLQVVFYHIFKPYVKKRDSFNIVDNIKTRLVFFALFLMFVAVMFVNQAQTFDWTTGTLNYLAALGGIFTAIIVLVAQYIAIHNYRNATQKIIATQLYEKSVDQYKAFQRAVDYVNIKCHDLKHQIRKVEKGDILTDEKLNKIMDGIQIYESFLKTGNETLDIVLTDVFLECRANNIGFSCMAEAQLLDKVERDDIYFMFTNLLENAIEHISIYKDEQKRFIRLTVKPVGKMLVIHIENYFEGNLELLNNLPITTKSDKSSHGFGIKSVKRIAEKYNGSLKISAEDNVFNINIMLQP